MSTPSVGEFLATILSIAINISEDRPAVVTRIVLAQDGDIKSATEKVTHIVRLNNPDSLRIGFDELRSAFPNELASLGDEDLLTHLIEKTDTFTGKKVSVGIENQVKSGIVQKNAYGVPYFNVRLRSAVRNMTKDCATSLARRMLQGIVSKKAVEAAFDEPAH